MALYKMDLLNNNDNNNKLKANPLTLYNKLIDFDVIL